MSSLPTKQLQLVTPKVQREAREDFFSLYFSYTSDTEVPAFFHRWAAITGIGAYLGRSVSIRHGHFTLVPNTYCMLVGSPGTRKTTAIKLMRNLLVQAGYNTIAADKSSKEKFLLDLSGDTGELDYRGRPVASKAPVDLDTMNIFGETVDETDKEVLIAADEFNDFLGLGNHDFISLLGNLWDYSGIYQSRVKNGKSVSIYNPTVSILGGNTPTGFSLAFPTEILGQGFFSRLLLVYGDPSGKKIAFPEAPDAQLNSELVEYLRRIKTCHAGNYPITKEAKSLLTKIYNNWRGLEDARFDSYSQRRFTHLLKLCLIITAARLGKEVTADDVVYSNTILSHTEHLMPKALGEFGKSKHSDTVHKIMQLLDSVYEPLGITDIWKHVIQDLDKIGDLADILRNLVAAEKIQQVPGTGGFLTRRKVLVEVCDDMVDYGLLTKEELGK
jgi:hypothetical protein